ncbi:MAG TPA: hypothetical protein VHP36_08545 [Chitinispirillaceae bacterium]|nr:hypothetical protein [Chitinispirillaceae bacterium]
MRTVTLIDTTLRDGAQAPDIQFTADDRMNIVDALYRTGVTEIEAGIPAMGNEECCIIQQIVRKYSTCHVSCWCRAKNTDISSALETGCDTVHISFPLSDIHLSILKKDETWLFDTVLSILKFAKSQFSRVSIGCQDATRAPLDRLIRFIKAAIAGGAFRIRIADTIGVFTPLQTFELISGILVKVPDANLEFHAHNDLGMATANSISAIQAGASAVSLSVNGIGERTGNAPLEEVAIAISRCFPDIVHGLNTYRLFELCKLVSVITGKLISYNKPVTGEKIFTHESGIHCHGLTIDSSSYEPYDPLLAGRAPSQMVAGTHSGTAGVFAMLKQAGIDADRKVIASLIPAISDEAKRMGRSLFYSEVKRLYLKMLDIKNQISSHPDYQMLTKMVYRET